MLMRDRLAMKVLLLCVLLPADALSGDGVAIWEQTPIGTGSTLSYENCGALRVQLADGFVGNGEAIEGIAWWGRQLDGTDPDAFRLEIWSHSADGCPESLLYSELVDLFTQYDGFPYNRYEAELAVPFVALTDTQYHLAITQVLCEMPDDLFHFAWAWGTGDGEQLCIRREGDPEWVPGDTYMSTEAELSFVLYSEMPTTPTTVHSWAKIKQRFRSDGATPRN